MNYLFNFMRVIALSAFGLLGPLTPPDLFFDAYGRTWAAIAVTDTDPVSSGWDRVFFQVRKDPLGTFVDEPSMYWHNFGFGMIVLRDLEIDTHYQLRSRSFQIDSGRFSNWVYMDIQTSWH